MSLEAFDPYLDDESIRAGGAEPRPLSAILAAGDFLSLHLPLTPETRNFLDHGRIGQMKRGACLICTARGGVVDEQALHQALKEGRLAGAALDVFTQEPPGALALLQHPHFIATPHLGAQTAEAQDRVALEIVREVMATLRGEAPRARVA
jgi:D-3-phosphoglycerate dehydrogenase